ncbi:MAG: hypothetical protein AAF557_08515 [Pseudomonadota bacterium]
MKTKTEIEPAKNREVYSAPKLQEIEMSHTALGPNPVNPEGGFAKAS